MEGAGSKGIFHGPIHRAFEHIAVIVIQSEYKTSIDHYSQGMQTLNGLFIILPDILPLVALYKIIPVQGLESDKYTAHTGFCRLFDQVAPENGVDGRGALKDPVHSLHTLEQGSCKSL